MHQECHRKFCHSFQIAKDAKQDEVMSSTSKEGTVLRTSEEDFLFQTDCFFCGKPAKLGKTQKHDVLQVKIIGIKETVLKICQE